MLCSRHCSKHCLLGGSGCVFLRLSITSRCSHMWCGNHTFYAWWKLQTHPVVQNETLFLAPLPSAAHQHKKPSQTLLVAGCLWSPEMPHVLGLSEVPDPQGPRKAVSWEAALAAALQTPTSITLGYKPQRPSPRKGTEITSWSSMLASG